MRWQELRDHRSAVRRFLCRPGGSRCQHRCWRRDLIVAMRWPRRGRPLQPMQWQEDTDVRENFVKDDPARLGTKMLLQDGHGLPVIVPGV